MLKLLKEAAIWFGCSLVAVCLALTGWGQPILAGVATVPVTTAVNDPYARIVVSTIFFVGMVWLMVNFVELAVVLSLVQIRTAAATWWKYVRLAEWERMENIEYVKAG